MPLKIVNVAEEIIFFSEAQIIVLTAKVICGDLL
jgi:hypothetical protein